METLLFNVSPPLHQLQLFKSFSRLFTSDSGIPEFSRLFSSAQPFKTVKLWLISSL